MNRLATAIRSVAGSDALTVFALLAAIDAGFILLHIIGRVVFHDHYHSLDISRDHSLSELFMYLEYILCMALLAAHAEARRSWHYLAWIPLFIYLLGDDSVQIHEKVGDFLAHHLDLPTFHDLDPNAIGELLATFLALLFFAPILLVGFIAGNRRFKAFSVGLAACIGLLGFFGVFVDVIHALLHHNKYLKFVMGIAEDGGEMFALSLILTYVAFHNGILDRATRCLVIKGWIKAA